MWDKINNMVKRDTEKKYAIFSMYGKIIIWTLYTLDYYSSLK